MSRAVAVKFDGLSRRAATRVMVRIRVVGTPEERHSTVACPSAGSP